jgi:hypothetical protein
VVDFDWTLDVAEQAIAHAKVIEQRKAPVIRNLRRPRRSTCRDPKRDPMRFARVAIMLGGMLGCYLGRCGESVRHD